MTIHAQPINIKKEFFVSFFVRSFKGKWQTSRIIGRCVPFDPSVPHTDTPISFQADPHAYTHTHPNRDTHKYTHTHPYSPPTPAHTHTCRQTFTHIDSNTNSRGNPDMLTSRDSFKYIVAISYLSVWSWPWPCVIRLATHPLKHTRSHTLKHWHTYPHTHRPTHPLRHWNKQTHTQTTVTPISYLNE